MRGDSLGRPRVDAFGPPHTLTWAKYEIGNRKERPDMRSPRTVAPHSYLPFLRGVSHNYAVNATHNAGHYPVRVSSKDPGNVAGKEFTTFNKVIYCYYVNYCFAEGLQRTSKLASEVLLYLFHSKPEYKGKPSSVIRILHRCLQSGTYRFPEPETLFEDALEILRTVPAATSWLTDKGAAKTVEDGDQFRSFQNAVEQGIRNVASKGSRLFKKGSIDSREMWAKVDPWRKRRCYVFLARHFLKRPNYASFNNFRFKDYVERLRLIKTYNAAYRFDPDGIIDLPVPEGWGETLTTSGDSVVAGPVLSSPSPDKPLEYDSDQEEWVEVISIDVICPYVHLRVSLC
jgi:hypothetical protein